MNEDFLEWLPPCIGARAYKVLGIPSTEMHMAVINQNIVIQKTTTGLERWLDKWL